MDKWTWILIGVGAVVLLVVILIVTRPKYEQKGGITGGWILAILATVFIIISQIFGKSDKKKVEQKKIKKKLQDDIKEADLKINELQRKKAELSGDIHVDAEEIHKVNQDIKKLEDKKKALKTKTTITGSLSDSIKKLKGL